MVECLKNSFVFVLNKFPLIFLFEKKKQTQSFGDVFYKGGRDDFLSE